MSNYANYGRQLADRMYKRRFAQRNGKPKAPSKRATTKPNPPVINWHPALAAYQAMPNINWSMNNDIASTAQRRLHDNKLTILQMPTGTGKTSTAIHALGLAQENLRKTGKGEQLPFIIVAPKAVIGGGSWQRTLRAWNDAHADNTLEPLMIESPDRFANLLNDSRSLAQIVKRLTTAGVVVIDEAHYYKTPTSKRSKKLLKLRHIHKLGLTATPFTNDAVMDGISYAVQAGMFNSKTACMRETGLDRCLDVYGGLDIYDNDKVDERRWPYYPKFKQQLAKIIYSPAIDISTLDMPHVHKYVKQLGVDLDLNAKLRSVYKASGEGAFESATDLVLALIQTIGESQSRLEALLELLAKPSVKQPLVFYWHNTIRDFLYNNLVEAGYQPQIIAGDTHMKDIDFDSDQPIMIQYQSGSEGIEFKRSNLTVFYQNQSSASRLEQAQGRNVRRGMTHDVEQYALVSDTRFDQEVFNRLRDRQEISAQVLAELALACADEAKEAL